MAWLADRVEAEWGSSSLDGREHEWRSGYLLHGNFQMEDGGGDTAFAKSWRRWLDKPGGMREDLAALPRGGGMLPTVAAV